MLNVSIGSLINVDGKPCLLTREGLAAHALYGPYERREAGRYAVEFDISAADGAGAEGDPICGTADVTSDCGTTVLGSSEVRFSHLVKGGEPIQITFTVERSQVLEYRFHTNGTVPVIAADVPIVASLAEGENVAERLAKHRFPDPSDATRPSVFHHHLDFLRHLHREGFLVELLAGNVVLTGRGISFHANESDDLRFVDEIFFRSAYKILLPHDACVIDIGMNIGLVSLLLATLDRVKEVHSYEPFPSTYNRALANLALNPRIATKIKANNFAISGSDEQTTVNLGSHGDSGMNSIFGSPEGTPVTISVRGAASVFKPILESANAKGLDVVAKIDCEGAEFAIIKALEDADMLRNFSALMVEWHRVFEGKSQQDLIEPLVQNGFVVFDVSPPANNGFFYAVRSR